MKQKSIEQLIRDINLFGLHSPTFVVADSRDKHIAMKLAKTYGNSEDYAFIVEKDNYFIHGDTLILYGSINQNVILLVRNSVNRIHFIDIYDLLKCAGAHVIKTLEINETTIDNYSNTFNNLC